MKKSFLLISTLLAAGTLGAFADGDKTYTYYRSTTTGTGEGNATLVVTDFTGSKNGEVVSTDNTAKDGYLISLDNVTTTDLVISGTIGTATNIASSTTNGGVGGRTKPTYTTLPSTLKTITFNSGIELNATLLQATSGITLSFDNASMYGNTVTNSTGTFAFNIDVGSGGLRLNGGSGTNYVYSGKITGTGNIAYCTANNTSSSTNTFTGDTSGFSGTWTSLTGSVYRKLIFSNSSNTYDVGGDIGTSSRAENTAQFNYSGDYKILGNVYVTNVDVLGGNATFVNGKTVSIGTLTVAASQSAKLAGTSTVTTLSNSGTLTLAGTSTIGTLTNAAAASTTISGASTITTADNSGTLTLSGTNVSIATLNNAVETAIATISGTATIGTATNAGTIKVTSTGTLVLADATTISGTGTFETESGATLEMGGLLTIEGTATINSGTLFDFATLTTGTQSTQLIAASGLDASDFSIKNLSENGVIVNQRGTATFEVVDNVLTLKNYTKGTEMELTWNGSGTDVWSHDGAGWTDENSNAQNFQRGDTITFGASATQTSIEVVGNVSAAAVTVNDNYTFTGTGNVSVDFANLTLATGKTLTWNSTGTLSLGKIENGTTAKVSPDFTGIKGSGTLEFALVYGNTSNENQWENTFTIDSGFTGTVKLTSGWFSIANNPTGTWNLWLEGGTSFQNSSNTDTTFNQDITFAGTDQFFHANSGKNLYLTGTITIKNGATVGKGGAGLTKLSGKLVIEEGGTFNANAAGNSGTVTITGDIDSKGTFTATNHGSPTGTTNITPADGKSVSIAALAVSQGTLNITSNSDTDLKITTLNATSGTTNIVSTNKNVFIETLTAAGTVNNNSGETSVTTATVTGTLKNAGTLKLGGGTVSGTLNNTGTASLEDVTVSGTFTNSGEAALERVLLSGTVNNTGTLNVSSLSVSNSTVATAKTLGNVVLLSGGSMLVNQVGQTGAYSTYSTKVSSLTLGGNASVEIGGSHAGIWEIDDLYLGTGVTSATLSLIDSHTADNTSIFAFGASSASSNTGTAFAGTIELSQVNYNGTRRHAAIQINQDILGSAVLDYKSANGTTATQFALAVNTTSASVAGLKSEMASTYVITVFSGEITSSGSCNNGGATNAYTYATSANTLTLDVNKDSSNIDPNYSFAGKFSGIEVAKTGDGTQTLSGVIADKDTLLSAISVSAGTLVLSGENTYTGGTTITGGTLVADNAKALGAGTTKISGGGQLTIGSASAVTLSGSAIEIVLDSYAGVDTAAAILGCEGSSISLGTGETIALSIVSATALEYHLFDSAIASNYEVDSFSLSEAMELAGWSIADYNISTGVITLAIPEPSMFGVIAGTLALALAGTRRRRRGNAK